MASARLRDAPMFSARSLRTLRRVEMWKRYDFFPIGRPDYQTVIYLGYQRDPFLRTTLRACSLPEDVLDRVIRFAGLSQVLLVMHAEGWVLHDAQRRPRRFRGLLFPAVSGRHAEALRFALLRDPVVHAWNVGDLWARMESATYYVTGCTFCCDQRGATLIANPCGTKASVHNYGLLAFEKWDWRFALNGNLILPRDARSHLDVLHPALRIPWRKPRWIID
jgi:hypothetical protein